MAFKELAGHAHAIDFLRRTIASGREGASIILHGPDGVGRRALALSLAQALNCGVEPGEGCGRCDVCRRIAHVERGKIDEGDHKGDARETTRHADVRIVVPGKEEIRIDAIRDLRQRAQRRPFEGKRSVFIVDPAERMTTEAANALLKTLEEPPPSSCLILIASDPDALLPTVRSRCRLLALHPLSTADLVAHLVKAASLTQEEAHLVATLSGGRPGRALRFDLDAYRSAREAVLEILDRLVERRPRAHVLKDAEVLGSREDDRFIEASLEILETLLRDAMVLMTTGEASHVVNRDILDALRRLGGELGDRIPDAMRRIAEARRDLGWNVNKQLLLEVLLLDLAVSPAPARA